MIKPIPETLKVDNHPSLNELDVDPNDDEMFLNEDDFDEMKQNKRRRKVRTKRKLANLTEVSEDDMFSASNNVHVVFKRQAMNTNQHNSDFGEAYLNDVG